MDGAGRTTRSLAGAAPDIDTLVENLPGNVYRRVRRADGTYVFEYLSSGLFRQFGIDPERLLDQEPIRFDWIHPDDKQRMVDDLEMSAATLGLLDHRIRVVGSDGRVHWARGIARPARRADGSVVWDGIVIDVTREIEAEMALRIAKEEADRARSLAADTVAALFEKLRRPAQHLATLAEQAAAPADARAEPISDAVGQLLAALSTAPGWPPPVASPARDLTPRQADVLALMRQGLSNKAIAQRLGISPGTAKLHAAAVLRALGAKGRKDLRG